MTTCEHTTEVLDGVQLNALTCPLVGHFYGGARWPIHDIATDGALLRVDVCGRLEAMAFADLRSIEDALGVLHDAETFYVPSTPPAP